MDFDQIKNRLRNQKILFGAAETVASELAKVASIIEPKENEIFVQQDTCGSEIYLILQGEVSVEVNGRERGIRYHNEQVGEMALINPGQKRSASLRAKKDVVLAKIDEEKFRTIATHNPVLIWNMAKILSERLKQRNNYEKREKNFKPKIFIASSSERLKEAEIIKKYLEINNDNEVNIWTDGDVFKLSSYTLPSLEQQAQESDFAVVLFGFEDEIKSRGTNSITTRDNVILESGLFIGALGRERVFVVHPQAEENCSKFSAFRHLCGKKKIESKMPTDLHGITTCRYDSNPSRIDDSLQKECDKMLKIIRAKGSI